MSKPSKPVSQEAAAKPDSKRRKFLIGASLGSVGAAAALVGAGGVKPAAEAAPAPELESKGYRETEHVRRYYGTTRL